MTTQNDRRARTRRHARGGGENKVQIESRTRHDVNLLMRQYLATGSAAQTPQNALYGDFSSVEDFHSTQNRIKAAEESFDNLPATVRENYRNDPGLFINDLVKYETGDEETIKSFQKLGIVQEPEAEKLARIEKIMYSEEELEARAQQAAKLEERTAEIKRIHEAKSAPKKT